MTSVYGGGGASSGTRLQHGRTSPPAGPLASPYDLLDLSPEPPGSPVKTDFEAHRRNDLAVQPEPPVRIVSAMAKGKARPRGESDLGRSAPRLNTRHNGAGPNGYAFPALDENGAASPVVGKRSSFTALPESLRAIILPAPYLLSGLAYELSRQNVQRLSLLAAQANGAAKDTAPIQAKSAHALPLIYSCAMAAITLILTGAYRLARLRPSSAVLDRRKTGLAATKRRHEHAQGVWSVASILAVGRSALGLLLLYFATAQVGGPRMALILLLMANEAIAIVRAKSSWDHQQTPFTLAVLALCLVLDLATAMSDRAFGPVLAGYLALAATVTLRLPPWSFVTAARPALASAAATSAVPSTPIDSAVSPRSANWHTTSASATSSPAAVSEARTMVAAGALLAALAVSASLLASVALAFSPLQILALAGVGLTSLGLMEFGQFPSGHGARITGTFIGAVLITVFSIAQPWVVPRASARWLYVLSLPIPFLGCLAVWADSPQVESQSKQSLGKNGSHNHTDQHNHRTAAHSALTSRILDSLPPGSLLHSIMSEKDSRRIAYFACLNLGFMLVQFFYGFVSGSLGLLTDSIHMLFDCAGLAVGLAAAVMSKWPPSFNFPYGYGKIDTLSGFANGIFLILVSVEIIFDAVHRLGDGHELRRLNELLVVSILGFLVNIVGLTAFGHAHNHHGHSHDHSHAHSHSHTDEHHAHHTQHAQDSHFHAHNAARSPLSATTPAASPDHRSHHHHHHHENENMQGIFLHILADALGSLSVIISTLLTQYTGWHGWDPIASCIISLLIFLSAVPLVKASGMKLLLALPDELEYRVRDALGELGSLRSVVGYQAPKFWIADNASKEHGHDHGHSHDHAHDHSHATGHGHGRGHGHDHAHTHSHHQHGSGDDGCSDVHDSPAEPRQTIMGVVHVTAARTADAEDVRERVGQFLRGRGIDATVQVDREGDTRCWCSSGVKVG